MILLLLLALSVSAEKITLVYDSVAKSCKVKGLSSPTPSPTPFSVCKDGELPPLNVAGFESWKGFDRITIADNTTREYCFTADQDTHVVALSVGDRTGSAQCSKHFVKYVTPYGRTEADDGTNSSYTFFDATNFLPRGKYKIIITTQDTPNCNDQYRIVAHY